MGGISEYLHKKAQAEQDRAKMMEKRLDHEQRKDRVSWAQELLKDPSLSSEMRASCQKLIFDAMGL